MNTTKRNHKRVYLAWTAEEVAYLSANYGTLSEKELQANLQNRHWHSITKKAQKLKLERTCFKLSKLEKLLQNIPEAYYWMGFLCADGNFTERRISVAVATKDINHLERFLAFVQSSNLIGKPSKGYHRVKITNVSVVKELRARFGIENNKTHHPCSIAWMNDEQFFSFLVGFFDGDGCLTQNKKFTNCFKMTIVGHPSWLPNFEIMQSFLYDRSGEIENVSKPKIRETSVKLPQETKKRKFKVGSFYITRKSILHWLRHHADELRLPYMQRKLGRIICPAPFHRHKDTISNGHSQKVTTLHK